MRIDLSGKVAIVTGGGRGLGRVIAETLAMEGVATCVADLRQDLLDDVAATWKRQGWRGAPIPCDVSQPADGVGAANAVLDQFGAIDIHVNHACVAGGGRVESLTEAQWDANLDINLKGTMLMCQAVIPAMQGRRSGRILNASSFAAIIPSVGGAAYAASKAGVESLTRVLASELGPFGITVNAYAPGMIPTEMNRFAERSAEEQARLLDTVSLRRWGKPEEVADLICFLASDRAAYITGALIDISGGKFATQMPYLAHRS